MATNKTTNTLDIVIPKPNIQLFDVVLRGLPGSNLICHAFSIEAQQKILDKQQKKAKTGKPARVPDDEYKQAMYRFKDGRLGFPIVAFKKAMGSAAATLVPDLTRTLVMKTVHVLGIEGEIDLVEIHGDGPHMRQDVVRLGGPSNPADLRFRPEWRDWWVQFTIRHLSDQISAEQVINLLALAGMAIGVGEMRAEKGGHNMGIFEGCDAETARKLSKR